MTPVQNGNISFWYRDLGGLPPPRPRLQADRTADVAIIGAGYTGLWAAYYLKKAMPSLDIVIVEKEFAGFGASGRNGGWLSGGFIWNHQRYLENSSRDRVRAMIKAMAGTVSEVVSVAKAEGIDADIVLTDELLVATNKAQLSRLQGHYAERLSWDVAEDRFAMISGTETRGRINMAGALGAMAIPGVARIQPAKLVTGLARVVEAMGVTIYEETEVLAYEKGRVTTLNGVISAPSILRATEGFTATLPGHEREWLPLNSAQIITEPLPDALWQEIGWSGCEIVGDYANAYCYSQRTRDGRIAMGGRGVPYILGSKIDDRGKADPETIRRLTAILHRHFPMVAGVNIDHAWCGVLGVPRDWCATVGYDRSSGLGWAGGYVGVGVSTSNLAGQTLADLVLDRQTERVTLPWVNRRVRAWEPEPLRYIGVQTMYALLNAADRREVTLDLKETSKLARFGNWLTGR